MSAEKINSSQNIPSNQLTYSQNLHASFKKKFQSPSHKLQITTADATQKEIDNFVFHPIKIKPIIINIFKIVAAIFFPLVILVSTIAALAYCLFQRIGYNQFIARFFGLPALRKDKKELDTLRLHVLSTHDKVVVQEKTLQISDTVSLNGIEVKNRKATNKWLIYFNGNSGCYEANFESIKTMSTELNVNVVCFNYRGVGKSSGVCLNGESLEEDAKACIQYLLDKDISAEDITCYGFSLGGAAAGSVLNKDTFSSEIIEKIRFINDRSFSTAKKASTSLIRIKPYSSLFRFLTKKNWNLKPYKNAKEIQGRLTIINSPHDAVIPLHSASYLVKAIDYAAKVIHIDFSPHIEKIKTDSIKGIWERFKAHGEAHYYDLPKEALTQLNEFIHSV
jgi:alpha/beta superfamily hydrolase